MHDWCAVPGCRSDGDLVYLNYPICTVHRDQPADALQRALGITVADVATTEEDMSEKKAKTAKKAAAKKTESTPEAAPAKKAKDKPTEPLKTFALRIPTSESDALHEATGSGKASKVVRQLLAAFVAGDDAAFRALVKESKEAWQ